MIGKFLSAMLLCAALTAAYPVCDNSPMTDDLRELMGDYIERLLPSNNSAAMISIQLTDQTQFYTLDKALAALKEQVLAATNQTKVGLLAYHSMAVLSTCNNPEDFYGVNLQELIQQRLKAQFFYKNKYQKLAFDGWYQYGLALQALCVGGVQVKQHDIIKALRGQESDGSWAYGVDETSQMLLGILCVKNQRNVVRIRNMADSVDKAIESAVAYLEASANTHGESTYFGNRYSTPEALLALSEANKVTVVDMSMCSVAAKTILTPLSDDDQLAAVYQRLPVISGKSVLALQNNWTCDEPGTTVEPSVPTSTTTTIATDECIDYTDKVDSETYITVTMLVIEKLGVNYTGPYDYVQLVDNVVNGTKLIGVMKQAECTGAFKYESRMTTWGASITSVNGLAARPEEREYWSQRDGATGASHNSGASSYVPIDNEMLLFKLATW